MLTPWRLVWNMAIPSCLAPLDLHVASAECMQSKLPSPMTVPALKTHELMTGLSSRSSCFLLMTGLSSRSLGFLLMTGLSSHSSCFLLMTGLSSRSLGFPLLFFLLGVSLKKRTHCNAFTGSILLKDRHTTYKHKNAHTHTHTHAHTDTHTHTKAHTKAHTHTISMDHTVHRLLMN